MNALLQLVALFSFGAPFAALAQAQAPAASVLSFDLVRYPLQTERRLRPDLRDGASHGPSTAP